jgi:thymus-specific serine protease
VEHRFYGESIPPCGLTDDCLHYLSSQQSTADLAAFAAYAAGAWNMTSANKWVTFGGSYAGALSAWMRLKYPHLISASVASSAPVEAKLDFTGYNDVVFASLSDPIVGGNAHCAQAVSTGFRMFDAALANATLVPILASQFLSCGPVVSDDDKATFASDVAGNFQGIVQYNNESSHGTITIATVCQTMMTAADPLAGLAAVNAMVMASQNSSCTDNSYADSIAALRNTSATGPGVGQRQWQYQTCTQFGYYQTCEPGTQCPLSFLMTLDSNLQICADVFNISADSVARRVSYSLAEYGGTSPGDTRVIYVNGNIDPWHALSVLDSRHSNVVSILVDGTAHCADLHPPEPTDPTNLIAARAQIADTLRKWLHVSP